MATGCQRASSASCKNATRPRDASSNCGSLLEAADALADLDAGAHDRVVLHVRHRDQPVDLADAEPVQHVGHQLLEPHVLDAGDALGAREVLRGAVAADLALARVV